MIFPGLAGGSENLAHRRCSGPGAVKSHSTREYPQILTSAAHGFGRVRPHGQLVRRGAARSPATSATIPVNRAETAFRSWRSANTRRAASLVVFQR